MNDVLRKMYISETEEMARQLISQHNVSGLKGQGLLVKRIISVSLLCPIGLY